jgi:putative transcription antitermination factor YqgF
MKYLGIDWGKRSVGLSISEGILASPFKSLSVTSLKDGINKIQMVITQESIDKVVIGIPESGEAKSMAQSALSELKKLGIEAVGVDETLSTQNAQTIMRSQDIKGSEHALSATLILQGYLDENP